MSVQRQQEASHEAVSYLDRVRERLSITVEDAGGGYHRAVLHAPHPGDPDAIVCRAATGVTRDQAVELARLELINAVRQHYMDPSVMQRARAAHIYDHGTDLAARRVQAAVVALGYPEPSVRQVGLAYVRLNPVGDVTVGEVARAVIGVDADVAVEVQGRLL